MKKLIILPLAAFMSLGVLGLAASGATFAGSTSDLAAQVLSSRSINLSSAARVDVERGVIDSRVLKVLLTISQSHTLRAGPLMTGHSFYVAGTTRPSNHSFGRAVDIGVVDGAAASASNRAAFDVVTIALSLPPDLRPDEVGSPWDLPDRGSFSDAFHRTHIHLGWRANS